MYQVVLQIITQLCICVLLCVIYTAISLSYISKNKLSYNNTYSDKALKNIMFYLLIIMCAIYNDGGDTIYLLDQIANKQPEYDKETLLSLKKAISKLKEREK